MSSRQHATTDDLEQATAATIRTLAGNAEIQIDFGAETARVNSRQVFLSSARQFTGSEALTLFRGFADAAGLRLRYHDHSIHSRYAPGGGEARKVFDRLEQIRCEALGARRLNGVAHNLQTALENHYKNIGVDSQKSMVITVA